MKFIFFLFIMICSVTRVIAQYPIPSYNVDVTQKASFQEQSHMGLINPLTLGKREINVMVTNSYPGHNNCQATVWFYSLDSLELLGPYTAIEGYVLTDDIDFKLWGALVESDVRNSRNKVRLH